MGCKLFLRVPCVYNSKCLKACRQWTPVPLTKHKLECVEEKHAEHCINNKWMFFYSWQKQGKGGGLTEPAARSHQRPSGPGATGDQATRIGLLQGSVWEKKPNHPAAEEQFYCKQPQIWGHCCCCAKHLFTGMHFLSKLFILVRL